MLLDPESGIQEMLFVKIQINYYFKEDDSALEFKMFFKDLMEWLLQNNNIYFVLSENYASKANRLRSYKKLHHHEIEEIGSHNLHEEEVEIQNELTVIASIVRLTNTNLTYCSNNLIDSLLRFGYIIPKGVRSFNVSRGEFLNNIMKEME